MRPPCESTIVESPDNDGAQEGGTTNIATKPPPPPSKPSTNKTLVVLTVLLIVGFIVSSILSDIEYLDQFNISTGTFGSLPHTYDSTIGELFQSGKAGVNPESIIQGQICDCKFLSAVAALVASDTGRRKVMEMIRDNHNGTYTVSFVGVPEPITVTAPTRQELFYSARTSNENGYYRFGNGIWLPVLEKAYGTYRNSHQTPDRALVRTIKHGLLEGRLSPESQIPSFGAAYGAFDEEACRVLTGHQMMILPTVSWELGEFGLGHSHASNRQLRSWAGRGSVVKEMQAEQHQLLSIAAAQGRMIIATTEGGTNIQETGIRSHHAYAVLAYDPIRQVLTLRDPLGSSAEIEYKSGPGPTDRLDGIPDGQFQILLSEFNKTFSRLAVEEGGAR